jgi:outer membrane PBP1 activator LpoA protein
LSKNKLKINKNNKKLKKFNFLTTLIINTHTQLIDKSIMRQVTITNKRRYQRGLLIYLTLIILWIAGCTSPTIKQGTEEPSVNDPAESAKRLEQQALYKAAAHEYLRVAAQMPSPTRQGHQLSAIRAFLKAGMVNEAKAELEQLDVEQSYGLEIPIEFAKIQIALKENQLTQAEKQLKGIESTTLSQPLRREYQQLQAQLTAAQGQILTALRDWINIDNLVQSEPYLLAENHQQLWQALTTTKFDQLQQLNVKSNERILAGWLTLALLEKSTPSQLAATALSHWRLRFSDHPATLSIVPNLLEKLGPVSQKPAQIALLLPLTHRLFGEYAQAVRNGFLLAAEQENSQAQISVTDTNDKDISKIYQQMKEAGIDFIVGPLTKDKLEKLATSQVHLPIPTLGLNHLEENVTTSNLYQFALSPEDEVKAVAKLAWNDGHRDALTCVPSGPWGEKLFETFKTQWNQLGGRIVSSLNYEQTFQQAIEKQLQEAKEADMAFVIAIANHNARQIIPIFTNLKPQLPIYSLSGIYTGTPNSVKDAPLENVTFVDMTHVTHLVFRLLSTTNFYQDHNEFNEFQINS